MGSLPLAKAALQAAFTDWARHQGQWGRLRLETSLKVYQSMWDALAAWCQAQPGGMALQALDAAQLQGYLASRHGMAGPGVALTPRYRLRLLGLVRRVQARDLARQGSPAAWGEPGPRHRPGAAALAWSEASLMAGPGLAMAPSDAPCSLPAAAVDQLLAWLMQVVPVSAERRWQALRDRAAVALQLGAGIGPGGLRALRLGDVQPPAHSALSPPPPGAAAGPADNPALAGPATGWWLQVPATGDAPAYLAPVAPWAVPPLRQWLHQRSALALPGPCLFPSTRSGKPWGKVAQYAAARQSLAAAGLPDSPGGSFRLRHSFALRQLVHGHDADTVARWLGVRDPAVLQRYRQSLAGSLIDPAAHGRHPAAPGLEGAPASAPWPV